MTQWNRLRTVAAIAALAIACFAGSAAAQNTVDKYKVTTPTLTWNDISGSGTQIAFDVVRYWDATSTTLPFDFKYEDGKVPAGTTIYLFNGTVGLGTSMWSGYNYGGLGDGSFTNCLFPWGASYVQMGDHATQTSGYNGATDNYGIFEEVTGSAPNRVYTIQMNGVHTAWGALWNGASCITNIQIKLYEGSGMIQFLYSAHGNYMSGSFSAEVGINGGTSNFTDNVAVGDSWYTPNSDIQFEYPAPPPEFSLQPKLLDFGGVTTGQTLVLNDTLSSIGGSDVTVTSATITGSTDYTILNPIAAGTAIAAGSMYVLQIQFAPTNSGNRNATLTVITNAADSAKQSCILAGTGLAPKVQYTFNGIYPYNTLFHKVSRKFGDSATQYFYVQNIGTGPLLFNSFQFIGLQASMYSVIHTPPNPLPLNGYDSIGIRFKPYLEGRPDAQLVVSTNALNTPYDTVTMFGTGMLPHLVLTPSSVVKFDSVGIGDSVCASIALHNTGTDTLKISKQIVTYGDYDYTFYPLKGAQTTLLPDQTKLVNICFVPVTKGLRMASIRFYTNIPLTYPDRRDTSQFLVSVTGTGVPYGKLSVNGAIAASAVVTQTTCFSDTIVNSGSAPLTLSTVKIHGATSDDFAMSGLTLPYTLAVGAKKAVQICFTARNRGPETDTLVLSGSTGTRNLSLAVPLVGTGLQPCMDATPTPVGFGSGLTLARTAGDSTKITVKNCGDVAMTFMAALATGTSPKYSLMNSTTPSIAPNSTGAIWVRFAPDTIGSVTGGVTITPSEGTLSAMTLPFTGVGAGAVIAPSGQPTPTMVTHADTFTVTLRNDGNWDWTPNPPQITGSEFTAVGLVNPPTIKAGTSGTIKIEFRPTATGTRSGQLAFGNGLQTPLNNALPYTLTGTATNLQGVQQTSEMNGFVLGATFPNPATGKTSTIVTVPENARVTLALVRLDGTTVMTTFTGDLTKGQHVVMFDASSLASGTYFCVLESGATRIVREMVVAR